MNARSYAAAALLAAAGLLGGCSGSRAHTDAPPASQAVHLPIDLAGIAVEPPGEVLAGVLWLHPHDPARNLLVGAAGAGGLVLRGLEDGAEYPGNTQIEAEHVTIAPAFGGSGDGALVVASDRGSATLWLFTVEAAAPALRVAHAAPLAAGTEVTGLCVYRSPASGRHYVFVAGDDGLLQQWELSRGPRGVSGTQVRRIALGSGIAGCAVDEADHAVYVADESVGIWRVAAEPESDAADRRLVDATAPRGDAGEEVKALAVFSGVLLALADEGGRLNAYSLPQGRLLGTVVPAAGTGGEPGELEALWAGGAGASARLVLPDPESPSGPRWRLLPWSQLAASLKLPAVTPADPRQPPAPSARLALPTVETEPVDDHGDAADDIAIWVHPRDPAQSLLVGAQKKRGIELYDLAGRRLQLLADGRMNNVDLRQGVRIGDRSLDVIAASNRTLGAISLYTLDAGTKRLQSIGAPVPTGMRDPYGLCMYVSARDGAVYVFVNNSDRGEFAQWRLEPQGRDIGARRVREFVVGSQAEGCVADDATGALYVAEEDVGLWRYSAEPDGGGQRRLIDGTGEDGNLTADAEGVALFHGPAGSGYLLLSNQGDNDYAVYRREGDNDYVGRFTVGANDALGIDGASETDGLEVTSRALGPAFPHGLLVVQDGRNITPAERQNFKLVPWEEVARALGLPLP